MLSHSMKPHASYITSSGDKWWKRIIHGQDRPLLRNEDEMRMCSVPVLLWTCSKHIDWHRGSKHSRHMEDSDLYSIGLAEALLLSLSVHCAIHHQLYQTQPPVEFGQGIMSKVFYIIACFKKMWSWGWVEGSCVTSKSGRKMFCNISWKSFRTPLSL